jgi:aminopeptidase N
MAFPPSDSTFKTLRYKQDKVHDFAWFADKRFHVLKGEVELPFSKRKVTLWSMFTNSEPKLWTKSIEYLHDAIYYYSLWNGEYPYNQVTAVDGSLSAGAGMEYPNVTVIGPSGNEFILETVIVHEVGHNWFYGILGSNERQHPWMDEGLNTFVQFLAEQEFDNNYPSRRGPAHKITDYMKMPPEQLEPIMTNSENIAQFGNNAYGKPATALNILRETIMGRELFDHAFKEYSRRWAFKHPSPADFYRTMEDASGVDLDWFWRGWFYDIEPVDISLDSVKAFKFFANDTLPIQMDTIWFGKRNTATQDEFHHISRIRNKQSNIEFLIDKDTTLRDFYYHYQPKETKTEKEEIEYV